MAIKVQNTSEIEFDAVKCVIYGGAGVGKTRTCATAPHPIIISAEEGLLSLSDQDIDIIIIHTLDDLNEAYNAVKKMPHKTVCLDSVSEIGEVLVEKLFPNYKDGRQAYAELARSMIPMLKRFRNLQGKNVVFTCKEDTILDDEGNFVKWDLLMPGQQLNKHIPYLFDELFHMQIDRKGVPFFKVKPDRKSFAKDRSGALNPAGESAADADSVPNLTEIFEKIRAKKSSKKPLVKL